MLNPDTAARIKACRGVYSVRDTARHFNVSVGTVQNIWHGRTHVQVSPTETPWVERRRRPVAEIQEEASFLLSTGSSVEETAQRLGVGQRRIKEVCPLLIVG